MLYTEVFCMRYYSGFSQIGSHMALAIDITDGRGLSNEARR